MIRLMQTPARSDQDKSYLLVKSFSFKQKKNGNKSSPGYHLFIFSVLFSLSSVFTTELAANNEAAPEIENTVIISEFRSVFPKIVYPGLLKSLVDLRSCWKLWENEATSFPSPNLLWDQIRKKSCLKTRRTFKHKKNGSKSSPAIWFQGLFTSPLCLFFQPLLCLNHPFFAIDHFLFFYFFLAQY